MEHSKNATLKPTKPYNKPLLPNTFIKPLLMMGPVKLPTPHTMPMAALAATKS